MKCILLLSGTVKAAGSGGQQEYKVEFLEQEWHQSWSEEWVHTGKFLAVGQTTRWAFGSGRGDRGGILIRPALLCGVGSSAAAGSVATHHTLGDHLFCLNI